MKLILFLIVCFGITSVLTQRLNTFFLPPSAPSYQTRETYFLGVTSNRKDLCVGDWLGRTEPMLIPNGVNAYKKLGMHDFVDYSPTFGYNLKIATIYADMSLYVYVNPLTSPSEVKCFTTSPPEMCMYGIDRESIFRLMNATFDIPPYHYIPEWAFVMIVIITALGVPMIIFIVYYMRRKRTKTYYFKFPDGSTEEIQGSNMPGRYNSDDEYDPLI